MNWLKTMFAVLALIFLIAGFVNLIRFGKEFKNFRSNELTKYIIGRWERYISFYMFFNVLAAISGIIAILL